MRTRAVGSPVAARRTPARTALYDRHVAAGAHIVDFAGWEMPQHYSSVREEQRAVRQQAGLFDVSHMGRFRLSGDGVAESLQRIVTNDLGAVPEGHAQYSLICNEAGGILDDLVVYRFADRWTVVVNASNRERDLAWIRDQAGAGVRVDDISELVGLLALQGPAAAAMLESEGVDVDSIPYFGLGSGRLEGVPVEVSRTGYTGEDGFELFVGAAHLPAVWDRLLHAGALPCGLAARDVCRLEAGLRLYGTDMDENTNPYEAGLGWTVKLGKGDFVGRSALATIREAGPERKLVGLKGGERLIPRHGAEVRLDGRPVGAVTGGTHSFWLEAGIGMAMVEAAAAEPGRTVEVASRGVFGTATLQRLPFYRGSIKASAPSPKS